MLDIAIPIVFPDYLIAVNTPKTRMKIPDLLPGFDIFPDDVEIPSTNNKVPELGHAGVLFIKGSSGLTKYYEYGRYGGELGQVRKLTIRDVKISGNKITKDSLSYTLSQISAKSGQNGRISAAYIEVQDKFPAMLAYANKRYNERTNPNRKPYSLFTNSCNHFMKEVLEAADIDLPALVDPRPNSYIEEIRDDHTDLDYFKEGNLLTIEGSPTSLALTKRVQQPASA